MRYELQSVYKNEVLPLCNGDVSGQSWAKAEMCRLQPSSLLNTLFSHSQPLKAPPKSASFKFSPLMRPQPLRLQKSATHETIKNLIETLSFIKKLRPKAKPAVEFRQWDFWACQHFQFHCYHIGPHGDPNEFLGPHCVIPLSAAKNSLQPDRFSIQNHQSNPEPCQISISLHNPTKSHFSSKPSRFSKFL